MLLLSFLLCFQPRVSSGPGLPGSPPCSPLTLSSREGGAQVPVLQRGLGGGGVGGRNGEKDQVPETKTPFP